MHSLSHEQFLDDVVSEYSKTHEEGGKRSKLFLYENVLTCMKFAKDKQVLESKHPIAEGETVYRKVSDKNPKESGMYNTNTRRLEYVSIDSERGGWFDGQNPVGKPEYYFQETTLPLSVKSAKSIEEADRIKSGQEHWKGMEVLKREGGYVNSETIKGLIDNIVSDVWQKAKEYYLESNSQINMPSDVIELLKRAKAFVPLYMPTKAHHEHNELGLDLIKCFEKYDIEWRQ